MRDLEPARGLGLECDQKAEDKDEDADDNKEHDFQDTTCQNHAESHDLISCNKTQEGFDTYKSEASLRNTFLKNQIAVASESEHQNTPEPIARAEVKGEVVVMGAVAQGEFWLSTHSPIVIPQTQLLTQSFVAITHLIRCHPQRQTLAVVEVVAALTSFAPEDSASQAANCQLMIKPISYLQPSHMAEEIEAVKIEMNPDQDDQLDQGSTEPELNMNRNGDEDLRLGSLEIMMIESDYSSDVSTDGEDDEEEGGKNDGDGAVEDMTTEDEESLLDSDAPRWDEVNEYNGEDAGNRI
ncbi:hypothetical protein PPACK8108_LOCUS18671 [Phakopsora pachyrhizi]|uniref:Uncharacterized protein n=1 Tax=Phakopsora pachyrhizi TaxID=170000 RepID=A0AAV0BE87_PHAPC|nr:hypothetical protein PPACK8108_LOCUS18671 [Phakopsora pachyrhizi]